MQFEEYGAEPQSLAQSRITLNHTNLAMQRQVEPNTPGTLQKNNLVALHTDWHVPPLSLEDLHLQLRWQAAFCSDNQDYNWSNLPSYLLVPCAIHVVVFVDCGFSVRSIL